MTLITKLPPNMEFLYYDKDQNGKRDKNIQIVKITTEEGEPIFARREAKTGKILETGVEKPKAGDFSELAYWSGDAADLTDKVAKESILGEYGFDDVSYECDDEDDDGHITFGRFMKVGGQSFVKNIVKPMFKHPLWTIGIGVGLALLGPQVAGFAALTGLGMGLWQFGKGTYNFFFKKKDKDAEQIKAAEDMWTGGILAGLSWIGVRKSSTHLAKMRAEKTAFTRFTNKYPNHLKIGHKMTWYKHFNMKKLPRSEQPKLPKNLIQSIGQLLKNDGKAIPGKGFLINNKPVAYLRGIGGNMKYSVTSKFYKTGAMFMLDRDLTPKEKNFYFGKDKPKPAPKPEPPKPEPPKPEPPKPEPPKPEPPKPEPPKPEPPKPEPTPEPTPAPTPEPSPAPTPEPTPTPGTTPASGSGSGPVNVKVEVNPEIHVDGAKVKVGGAKAGGGHGGGAKVKAGGGSATAFSGGSRGTGIPTSKDGMKSALRGIRASLSVEMKAKAAALLKRLGEPGTTAKDSDIIAAFTEIMADVRADVSAGATVTPPITPSAGGIPPINIINNNLNNNINGAAGTIDPIAFGCATHHYNPRFGIYVPPTVE